MIHVLRKLLSSHLGLHASVTVSLVGGWVLLEMEHMYLFFLGISHSIAKNLRKSKMYMPLTCHN